MRLSPLKGLAKLESMNTRLPLERLSVVDVPALTVPELAPLGALTVISQRSFAPYQRSMVATNPRSPASVGA